MNRRNFLQSIGVGAIALAAAGLSGTMPAEAREIHGEVVDGAPIDKFPVFARRMSFRCTPEVAQAFEEQRRAITAAVKYVDYNIGNYDGGGNDDDYDDD